MKIFRIYPYSVMVPGIIARTRPQLVAVLAAGTITVFLFAYSLLSSPPIPPPLPYFSYPILFLLLLLLRLFFMSVFRFFFVAGMLRYGVVVAVVYDSQFSKNIPPDRCFYSPVVTVFAFAFPKIYRPKLKFKKS